MILTERSLLQRDWPVRVFHAAPTPPSRCIQQSYNKRYLPAVPQSFCEARALFYKCILGEIVLVLYPYDQRVSKFLMIQSQWLIIASFIEIPSL